MAPGLRAAPQRLAESRKLGRRRGGQLVEGVARERVDDRALPLGGERLPLPVHQVLRDTDRKIGTREITKTLIQQAFAQLECSEIFH